MIVPIMKNYKDFTLGTLIDYLDNKFDTAFADGVFPLVEPHSYRGFYDQLALATIPGKTQSEGEFRDQLIACLNKSFEGYKGGSFVMNEDVRVYVVDYIYDADSECDRPLNVKSLYGLFQPNDFADDGVDSF